MDSTEPNRGGDRVAGRIWRFADCEFDERRRELRVRDSLVDIEVKPLEVLHQLLLHAGEVVTKAELLEAVWPDVAVVDGSLATAVSKVRKLLNDDGSVIATVPRVGYKLAVPVQSRPVAAPARPDLRLEPGQPIPGRDQWRLARRLDLSPSSEVWLAEHPKTHDTRVFKFAPDAARLKSLKREVTVARLLRESLGDRPEFVRVLEWNFESHPYFIESEYAGPNLVEWAEAQGGIANIPLDARLKLLTEAADAVAAAHAVDVLHKDLKPANILIASAPGGASQVRIADFGSASLLEPSRLSAFGITNLGFTQSLGSEKESLSGTAVYLAPEVLAGQSPTAASDVYALGVLLYQLVVGDFRRPFAPGWEADIAEPLIREDIAAAAAGDASRRITTAAELATRLRNLDRRRLANEEAHQRERAAMLRQARASSRGRWLAFTGIGALFAAVVVMLATRSEPTPSAPRSKTVAVLSFQNTGADPTTDFLRLAVPDDVATMLSRTREVAVRPFSTTSAYESSGADVQKLGREIRAEVLVTGRIVKAQDQLHITLEAIDVESNALLWRDTIEAPAHSMIAMHQQLRLAVRGGLAPALGASVTDAAPEPRNEEAYELYIKASVLPFDPAPNPQAMAMLQRAAELDPMYPPIWHDLGRRYYVEAHHGSGNPDMLARSEAAIERAVALDPANVTSAATLVTYRIERGDLVRAHEQAQALVRRRPDNVVAHFVMSYVLRYAGLLDESAAHCEKAVLIDPQPVNTSLRSCGVLFFVRGNFTGALNYVNLDRESEVAKSYHVDLLIRQGKTQAALAIGMPQIPQYAAKYAMVFACARGRPQSEIAELARAVRPAADPEENYFSAAHLSYCGQTAAAGEMLKRAIQGNYCSYPAMETDPLFANLRATAEYGEILASGRTCQEKFLAERARPRQ